MLFNIFKDIFLGKNSKKFIEEKKEDLASRAAKAMNSGNPRAAADLYKNYLEIDPKSVDALNNLGICLAEVGNITDAYKAFDLAYSLDDSNMAVVLNHARHLIDNKNIKAAMPHILRARVTIPDYPYINAVYATTRLAIGDTGAARNFTLRAWLAQFDNLRLANSYLFTSSYAEMPESMLASEHLFWGKTVSNVVKSEIDRKASKGLDAARKIRIGYWSPDFRSHSVRYFFRPLLEGHDRNNVEIILYNDSHLSDSQTELIKIRADEFHEVAQLSDQKLYELIISHELDVLVELAGHTSHNRMNLLMNRMAKLQFSGLGYPPTTGLSTLDGKFLDPYLETDKSARYYTEEPLILPSSFWCFDPLEEAPLADLPPLIKNGFVTFGCVGNIAKINNRALDAWRKILQRVPRSRLIIRAVNFVDQVSVDGFRELLVLQKLPVDRVDIIGPAAGADFFTSYNELDIILDTMPFNGGTTTCFAVFMGVPVVSVAGESLIGRMGLSVLSNLGYPDLAVPDEQRYISRAVALSQDITYLSDFKKNARTKMRACSLGNGRMFAKDVEGVFRERLKNLPVGNNLKYISGVEHLPAKELIRRAYLVLGHGQVEAAARIVAYCLENYPDFGPAHILATEDKTSHGDYLGAAEYLLERLENFQREHRSAVLFNVVRCYLMAHRSDLARNALSMVSVFDLQDQYDRQQFDLYKCRLLISGLDQPYPNGVKPNGAGFSRLVCLIPCDDESAFQVFVESMRERCIIPEFVLVEFRRCNEIDKFIAYQKILADLSISYGIFLQKNIHIHSKSFFVDVLACMKDTDLLSFSGAKRWIRLDWQFDRFDEKMTGCFVRSSENAETYEIKLHGNGREVFNLGMVVLDGAMIAFNREALSKILFDEDLMQSGLMLEQVWSYQAWRKGLRLAVHRNLGVEALPRVNFDEKYVASAKMSILSLLGAEPFLLVPDDNMSISVPVNGPLEAMSVMSQYLKKLV